MEVGILVFAGADELDVVGPFRVFTAIDEVRPFVEAPPVSVHLVAERSGAVRMAHGLVLHPTTDFAGCPPLDVVVVPGGGSRSEEAGIRIEQGNEAVLEFVRNRSASARLTASVCTGAFILASAGLLAGRRANTHWFWRDQLRELMSARGESFEVVPERVVWDGDLVTAGGVTSGIDLALAIVERLCGEAVRDAVERAIERETSRQASERRELRMERGDDIPRFEMAAGIEIRPIVGERLNVNVVVLQPGAVAQVHAHQEEQVGYVVSGACEFGDGTTARLLRAGDAYHAPPGAPHGARALEEGCVILDAFSPPKAEVLEMLGAGR